MSVPQPRSTGFHGDPDPRVCGGRLVERDHATSQTSLMHEVEVVEEERAGEEGVWVGVSVT